MKTIFSIAAVLGAMTAAPAFAQSDDAPSADDLNRDTITVGVAAAYLPDYLGSNDYRWVPAPAAIGQVDGFAFNLTGNRLSIDLIPDHSPSGIDFQAGPIGVINFNRSSVKKDSIDDPRIRALGKLKKAIEIGGYVGIGKTGVITSPYDKLSVSVSYRKDVNNVHDSGIWQPSVNYFTPLSRKAAVGVFGSAQYVKRGYGRTYFSVTRAQSLASGLPIFTAGKGWLGYTLGTFGTVSLSGDLLHGFKLIAGGTYTRLENDFARSPLTSIAGKRSQWLGAAGVAYTF